MDGHRRWAAGRGQRRGSLNVQWTLYSCNGSKTAGWRRALLLAHIRLLGRATFHLCPIGGPLGSAPGASAAYAASAIHKSPHAPPTSISIVAPSIPNADAVTVTFPAVTLPPLPVFPGLTIAVTRPRYDRFGP